jgi:hypothetical protein
MCVVTMNRPEEKLLQQLVDWENEARERQGIPEALDKGEYIRALIFRRAQECGLIHFPSETPSVNVEAIVVEASGEDVPEDEGD